LDRSGKRNGGKERAEGESNKEVEKKFYVGQKDKEEDKEDLRDKEIDNQKDEDMDLEEEEIVRAVRRTGGKNENKVENKSSKI